MAGIGTELILQNEFVNVWEMVLPPQQSSGIHTHQLPWHFVVTRSAALQIEDENGNLIVPPEKLAVGVQMSFVPQGDRAVCIEVPTLVIPCTHQAVNVSDETYGEILVEMKAYGDGGITAPHHGASAAGGYHRPPPK